MIQDLSLESMSPVLSQWLWYLHLYISLLVIFLRFLPSYLSNSSHCWTIQKFPDQNTCGFIFLSSLIMLFNSLQYNQFFFPHFCPNFLRISEWNSWLHWSKRKIILRAQSFYIRKTGKQDKHLIVYVVFKSTIENKVVILPPFWFLEF